jgi:vancomycin permeability regulator SanA
LIKYVKRIFKKVIGSRKVMMMLLMLTLLLNFFLISSLIIALNVSLPQKAKIFTSIEALPTAQVGIVFGAGVTSIDQPRQMLIDRLSAGVALYKTGKVQKLLMTGGEVEVITMHHFAENAGVSTSAIIDDAGGLRTYDSCYRAAYTFNINSAIAVTQEYHLPRAIFLCSAFGINTVGYKAGGNDYPNQIWNKTREFSAQVWAWFDINFFKPQA